MKHVISLEEVPQYDALDEEELIQELRRLESMQQEINTRHKVVKNNLFQRLDEKEDKTYQSDKYKAYIKEVKSQRIDNQWVKNFVKEQNIEPKYTESVSKKLNVKRID